MENITNTSNEKFLFILELWTGDLVISSILVLITVYVTAAVIYHHIKLIHSKNEKFSLMALEKKFAILSKFICILIAVISVIRTTNAVALLFIDKTAILANRNISQIDSLQTACQILPRIGIFTLTIGTGLVYLFLWFRQRVFYVHPSINILNNRLVRATSWGIILVWFLYYISAMISYFVLVEYQFDKNGRCLVATGRSSSIYFYISFSWVVVSILMQIALLGLFIFPIIRRTLWRTLEENRNSVLLQRVRKAIIITVVCLASDILSAIFTQTLTRPHETGFNATYSINLLINHLATVACFDYWKLMLWPWKHYPSNTKNQIQKSDPSYSETFDQKTMETYS